MKTHIITNAGNELKMLTARNRYTVNKNSRYPNKYTQAYSK